MYRGQTQRRQALQWLGSKKSIIKVEIKGYDKFGENKDPK